MIFLLIYDTRSSKLIGISEFEDAARDAATHALHDAQERYISELDSVEVALFEADERVTLEQTHSRYFKSLKELGEGLAEVGRKSA